MSAEEIVERIMTMHWDIKACDCWICVKGREANCHPCDEYLRWRGLWSYVKVEGQYGFKPAEEGTK